MITANQSILGAEPSGENSIPDVVKAAAQGASLVAIELPGGGALRRTGLFLTPNYFLLSGSVPIRYPWISGATIGGDEPPTIEKFSIINRGVAWSSGGIMQSHSRNQGTAQLIDSGHILDYISPGNYRTSEVTWIPPFNGLHLTTPPTVETNYQIPVAEVAFPFPGSSSDRKNANRGEPVYAVIAKATGTEIIPGFVTHGKRNERWTDYTTLENWLRQLQLQPVPSSKEGIVLSSFQSYWFPKDLPPGTPIFTQ